MSNRRIIVTIDGMGNPKIEADGFAGMGCVQLNARINCINATAPIEKALPGGAGGVEREMKPEWHQSEETNQSEQVTW